MAQVDAFFKLMAEKGASDLHLAAGRQPTLRINGDIERIRYNSLENTALTKMLYEITPQEKIKTFEETGDVDFVYEIPEMGRYRANYFRHTKGIAAVFRSIPKTIPDVDQLGLPPLMKDLAMLPRGLVLVTGPTGSGKSTTLAAIIDYANQKRKDHIITIEEPVEFAHSSRLCIVEQREVGVHTRSFKSALRSALREDPDIILVGEMRDYETIALAIEAANTGHLVFSTLHTASAAKTVDRIVEVFPADQQNQIRSSFADSICAVISQVLFKRAGRPGRVPALEILLGTTAIRNQIREEKTKLIPGTIQASPEMVLMDDAIKDLYKRGVITHEEAYLKINNKDLIPVPKTLELSRLQSHLMQNR